MRAFGAKPAFSVRRVGLELCGGFAPLETSTGAATARIRNAWATSVSCFMLTVDLNPYILEVCIADIGVVLYFTDGLIAHLEFPQMNPLMELAVVREALQSRLIVELMANAMHKEFVLKGGMAMRVVHGSVRYTKDIDLDADLKHSTERVRSIVRRSIERAIASGLIANAKVTEPKQTETTLRWKIVGTQPGSNAPLHLTVEVSRRASLAGSHVIEVPLSPAHAGGAAGVKVQVLDSQAIAVTKVLALTHPNRTAPRDLFDLHVLIEAQVADPTQIFVSLPKAREYLPRAVAELWPKLEAMTYAQFRSEVLPYLPGDVAGAINEDVFDDMRLKVGARVEKWLKTAIDAVENAATVEDDRGPSPGSNEGGVRP